MSAFSPLALSGASDQKRALIERLMEQYQQAAGRAAGLASGASAGGAGQAATSVGMNFRHLRPFGGGSHLTGLLPNLGSILQQRLGPGGIGHAIAGIEGSVAHGAPVGIPAFGAGYGHGLAAPGGPPHPIAPSFSTGAAPGINPSSGSAPGFSLGLAPGIDAYRNVKTARSAPAYSPVPAYGINPIILHHLAQFG